MKLALSNVAIFARSPCRITVRRTILHNYRPKENIDAMLASYALFKVEIRI